VTIEVDVSHTIVRGHGLFYRNGSRTERCLFSFRFNDDLEAGWLKFFDVRAQMSVEVGTVKQVTVTGTQATIVCGDSDEYTIEVDAATDYFKLTGPGYQADSGHSTRDRCEIVIEELTPE